MRKTAEDCPPKKTEVPMPRNSGHGRTNAGNPSQTNSGVRRKNWNSDRDPTRSKTKKKTAKALRKTAGHASRIRAAHRTSRALQKRETPAPCQKKPVSLRTSRLDRESQNPKRNPRLFRNRNRHRCRNRRHNRTRRKRMTLPRHPEDGLPAVL